MGSKLKLCIFVKKFTYINHNITKTTMRRILSKSICVFLAFAVSMIPAFASNIEKNCVISLSENSFLFEKDEEGKIFVKAQDRPFTFAEGEFMLPTVVYTIAVPINFQLKKLRASR